MRAANRLLLLALLAAIAAGIALPPHSLLPGRDGAQGERRRERPVVQAVDLSRLAPELRRAVESARNDGLQHARSELEGFHAELMHKLDGGLLDWYFRYSTQQRLALGYAWDAGKSWLVGFVVDVEPGRAEKALQGEIARAFELRVMPTPVLEQKLQDIAHRSVGVFVRSLQAHLADMPKQFDIPAAQWEDYLDGVSFMVGGTEASRNTPLTLKALATAAAWSGLGATAALAPLVSAQLTQRFAAAGAAGAAEALSGPFARRAATTVTRQAASRGVAAGAGSFGGALGGGAALAALVAWEAFDHASTVAENRPLLRSNIDHFLRLYENGLVEPHGMIGAVLHDIEKRIAAAIPA